MRRAARCPLCTDQMDAWRIVCRRCYNETDGLRSKFHHRTGIEITEEEIQTWKQAMQARRAQMKVEKREEQLEERERDVSSRMESIADVIEQVDEILERLERFRSHCWEAQRFSIEALNEVGPRSSAGQCRSAINQTEGFLTEGLDYCDEIFDCYVDLRVCQSELERLVDST